MKKGLYIYIEGGKPMECFLNACTLTSKTNQEAKWLCGTVKKPSLTVIGLK